MNKFYILSFLLLINFTFAQWSNDPGTNLLICDLAGEQALAKIAMTSDGGCYISWFDTRSGTYNVYLQLLDPLGNKMWAPDGLLISNNPQDTWITDYDLICDQSDNAVLVFSDIRVGGDLKPFAYRISPTGDFLWGSNGIDISTTDSFQPSPTLTETSDGNFVFAWISTDGSQKIALQKLSSTGQKLWGTDPILLQSATENYSYPSVVASDNGQVILVHTVQTGGFPPQVRIRAHKLDTNGQLVWGTSGISIQDNGLMAFFQVPEVVSEESNGAMIAWYDGRGGGNLSSSFVQRISSDGTLFFPANGAEGSLAALRNKFYPQVAFNSATQETYMFWIETEPNQTQNGIYGQKFSPTGNRIWGDNGMVFIPLSAPNTKSLSDLSAHMGNNLVYVFYLESEGSGLNTKTQGFAADTMGGFFWSGDIVTLSNTTVEKLQMETALDVYKNCKLVWGDKRLDASGIYAQDINPSGQLGQPVVPVELVSFNAELNNDNVTLSWMTSTETNNSGFEIHRKEIDPDNSKWTTVGFVAGNGTTTEPTNYIFIDDIGLIQAKRLTYRLKQIDFDGHHKFSNEIIVENITLTKFSLEQNYPNPFNPTTTIQFSIPEEVNVSLKIYDAIGSEVETILNQKIESGNYKYQWDASAYPGGVYFYLIIAGNFVNTKKLILLK